MNQEKPIDTSTPKNYVRPTGRPGIRNQQEIVSPIENRAPTNKRKSKRYDSQNSDNSTLESESDFDEDGDGDDDEDEDEDGDKYEYDTTKSASHSGDFVEKSSSQTCFVNECQEPRTSILLWISLVGFLAVATGLYFHQTMKTVDNAETFNSEQYYEQFSSQHNDLWGSIESAVNDSKTLDRPSTFIFLYKEQHKAVLENLVSFIGSYVTINLRDKKQNPLVIEGDSLNSLTDYGEIITTYKEKLEASGVMIVKNLEQIGHVQAQAFHTICDQYTPLVSKSMIIFTIKVDKYVSEPLNIPQSERLLRKVWKEMPDDVFHPLWTRLSNAVFNVMP